MTVQLPGQRVETARGEVLALDELVEGWVAAGVITPEQADRMRLSSPPRGASGPRSPVVAEALAYLGGAVVVAGCILIGALYWSDLDDVWRFALLLAATALLLGGGALVPLRLGPVGRRLRAVLWLASSAAWTGAAAVLVSTGLGPVPDVSPDAEATLVAGLVSAYALTLWFLHRHVLQQVALLVALAVLCGAGLEWLGWPGESGIGVWALGVVWIGLGRAGVFRPPEVAVLLGSATAVLGSMTTTDSDAGMVFVLVTVLGVVVAAILTHDLVLLGLGALATLLNLPMAMARWFAGSLSAAFALVLAGAVLVAAAVWVARRGPRRPSTGPAGDHEGKDADVRISG